MGLKIAWFQNVLGWKDRAGMLTVKENQSTLERGSQANLYLALWHMLWRIIFRRNRTTALTKRISQRFFHVVIIWFPDLCTIKTDKTYFQYVFTECPRNVFNTLLVAILITLLLIFIVQTFAFFRDTFRSGGNHETANLYTTYQRCYSVCNKFNLDFHYICKPLCKMTLL